MKKSLLLKISISILSIIIFLHLFLQYFDFHQVFIIISRVNLKLFLIAVLIYYASFVIKALRWKKLLEGLGIREKFSFTIYAVFSSFFLNSLAPMRFGDFYRMYLLKNKQKIPISRTLGTIFIEKFIDVIFLVLIFLLSGAFIINGIPKDYLHYIFGAGLILISFFIGTILFLLLFREKGLIFLTKRITGLVLNFKKSLKECSTHKTLSAVVLLTVADLAFASVFFYAITLSIGISLSFINILFLVAAESLLTAVPITPAGIGFVESGVAGILILWGFEKNLSLSVALLERLVTYWLQILLGLLVFLVVKSSKIDNAKIYLKNPKR